MPSHVLQVACLQCSASAPASQYLVPWQYQEVNLLAQFLPMSFMFVAIFSHCFNMAYMLIAVATASLGSKADGHRSLALCLQHGVE